MKTSSLTELPSIYQAPKTLAQRLLFTMLYFFSDPMCNNTLTYLFYLNKELIFIFLVFFVTSGPWLL
ncbi:unnamed protein product [Brassica napus]|uniref:(rape) hypothetical protein n=1 Tax=Brassica napus TaxID=3708 RepID=A0A816JB68_BRANA|nr:unnamed protein product [Brassica napus]